MSGAELGQMNGYLPPEIYQKILELAAQEFTQKITATTNTPHNGQARKNRFLASILGLDKSTYNYLKRLTWHRLKIHFSGEIQPTDVREFEDLQRIFDANKSFTRVIDLSITAPLSNYRMGNISEFEDSIAATALLKVVSQMFQRAPKSQIREVLLYLGFTMVDLDDTSTLYWKELDRMMTSIGNFKKLTSFRFITGLSMQVLESELGWIISHLPNLECVLLWCTTGFMNTGHIRKPKVDLGEALATRTQLKSLEVRELVSPNINWLKLDWKGPLQNLCFETNCESEISNPLVDEHLLSFSHLFRKTLTSLSFIKMYTEANEDEKSMARDFSSLRSVRYFGDIDYLSVFAVCPNVQNLTLIEYNQEDLSAFASECFPNGLRWPKLKTIELSQIETYGHLSLPNCFLKCLRDHSIELKVIDFPDVLNPSDAMVDISSTVSL
ncbi:hypothetical protein CROQUDRAFT_671578 [Cronartium quercuum f. sp. fusiforme G11]|uniref:Uncharacterized protein n=1 Tax=Cronartium quercuum f. sp. fusiforme G11 TaxID=708437 RepID=A0A9P6NHM9_9BASI|nr:hypothetical protein CROQUDRAFT_671578 [Cronartium quercuum f. sp. fusiforme G11]